MSASVRLSRGRADPFGLLVVMVMLALSITIGIQAQASVDEGRVAATPPACTVECPPAGSGH
jgi:hypothetical protein